MKVAVFTGPTGGHFYPALAFIEALKRRSAAAQILLVTGLRGRFLVERIPSALRRGLEVEFLPDFPFPRPKAPDFLIRLFPFLLKLAQAFWKTESVLSSFQPNLCVGFGSYIAFPGVLAARRRGIPTLIHEQNQTGGEANARLSRFADRIALSFEKTEGLVSTSAAVTGLPLRASLVEKASRKGASEPRLLSRNRLRILLLGGSQGSLALNRLWQETLDSFSGEELKGIAVIHITGEKDFETVSTMYRTQGIEAKVFSFYERMEELYPEVDFAITRAGAGTLFELALFGLPAIVFPYPHAGAHQERNASYFEKEGAVVLLREGKESSSRFRDEVRDLIHSPEKRNRLSQNFARLARPEAADRLVDLAEELVGRREACFV